MANSTMAPRQGGLKPKKWSSKSVNSPSSKLIPEASLDNPSPNSSARYKQQNFFSKSAALDSEKLKEDVTVTVRFRPLSPREIRQGEGIAWYADGETIVRNDHIHSLAYAYDQVFGPTTTTCHVYDVAARRVVSGAMEGINGTIFAYGMTSSGKTHTMHGDQRSPGIIPLAVKDAFHIIQETPCREFLLRLSYLEIYNEVVNDLLNPSGQNLRIREGSQGAFVEGIKEEVILSPAHALSVIAAGEEQRHVGSTNFNLHSSKSHTIFTLTIESSSCSKNKEREAASLSQLNLIDLAGSESSKSETTGLRRKEGSYINKSLLTLGTVITKLTDGKAAHIPYRDSKLTRILQSSLSGHGRVSLICTVTPSSRNSEETHNTLKFGHHAKHIEIQAAQNKFNDEKSLIKTYQNEIRFLKEELEQLMRGIVTDPQLKHLEGNDIVLLKEKVEDGQVKLQSELEQVEEEEAKAALLSQIQNLTKLILVSTKSLQSPSLPHDPAPGSRFSFGEEELAYLPHRRRDLSLDDESIQLHVTLDEGTETKNDALKEYKKIKKPGLLNWLKPRKRDGLSRSTVTSTSEKSSGAKSTSTPSTPANNHIFPAESRHSYSSPSECTSVGFLSDARQYREINIDAFLQQEAHPASKKTIDQIDLLREQQRILSEKVVNQFTALKRLSEEAAGDGNKESIKAEMTKLNDEIKKTNEQIYLLEEQTINSVVSSHHKTDDVEKSRSVSELEAQLKEKSFEVEVQTTDNQVIQEQLNQKVQVQNDESEGLQVLQNDESKGLQETITALKQEVSDAHDLNLGATRDCAQCYSEPRSLHGELYTETEYTTINDRSKMLFEQAQNQALDIEQLKQKVAKLTELKEQLEAENKSLAEESSYAKELASAAAIELKVLSEEVVKLMNHNEKLSAELAARTGRRTTGLTKNGQRNSMHMKQSPTQLELKRELAMSKEREKAFEAILYEKDQRESELQQTVKESKEREAYLENEVANMWILVAGLKKSQGAETNVSESSRGVGFEI